MLTGPAAYIFFASLALAFIAVVALWRYRFGRRPHLFAEQFLTAGRDMRTGVVTASLLSLWLWPMTFVSSAVLGRHFGISGPFWFAVFGAAQILLMTALITSFRSQAGGARTLPEYLRDRFGPLAHRIAVGLVLVTCSYVLLWVSWQGMRALSALTGASGFWLALAIPVAFAIPAWIGGLRGTIVLGWLQALVIVALTLTLVLLFYARQGSAGLYRELALQGVGDQFLALGSWKAILAAFGLSLGSVGLLLADQSYWQRAIAASPRASGPAFIYTGLSAFTLPVAVGTTFGTGLLAFGSGQIEQAGTTRILAMLESFIPAQIGSFGLVGFLVILCTAMFATGTAELFALASVLTVDVIGVDPAAEDRSRREQRLARGSVALCAVAAAGLLISAEGLRHMREPHWALATGMFSLLRTAVINSAIVPLALAIVWRRSNVFGALGGILVGSVTGVAVALIAGPEADVAVALRPAASLVPGVSILSSGLVCVFGGVVFSQAPSATSVALTVREPAEMPGARAWWARALVGLGGLALAGLIVWGRLPASLFGLWITAGLILLFLATAYICMMPIKEYFEVAPDSGGPAIYPQCALPERTRE
jgi:Na+/proline symporter